MPQHLHLLGEKLANVERLLMMQSDPKPIEDQWFDLNELVEYDPEKRSRNTFYGYICKGDNGFPYHKKSKKITILKSEFDQWLKSGKKKTDADLEEEVNQYLSNKKGSKS